MKRGVLQLRFLTVTILYKLPPAVIEEKSPHPQNIKMTYGGNLQEKLNCIEPLKAFYLCDRLY